MSTSQYLAKLGFAQTVPGMTTSNFYFAKFESDTGHIPLVVQMQQEVIKSPGVSGIRYLDLQQEPQPFVVDTWEDFSSYQAAVIQCANYELSRSLYGYLVYLNNGVNTGQILVKIVDIASSTGPKPKPYAGPMGGFGATVNSAAWVDARWTLHIAAP